MTRYSVAPTQPREGYAYDYAGMFPFSVVDEHGREVESFAYEPAALFLRDRLEWEASQPVEVRTSGLLIEVRAVRSKALTTVETTVGNRERYPDLFGPLTEEDKEILADLEKVVSLLDKWQRTGRMPRYPGKK